MALPAGSKPNENDLVVLRAITALGRPSTKREIAFWIRDQKIAREGRAWDAHLTQLSLSRLTGGLALVSAEKRKGQGNTLYYSVVTTVDQRQIERQSVIDAPTGPSDLAPFFAKE